MSEIKETRIMSTRLLTALAMFSALAAVLMFLEFPLPFLFPPFLKFDFSELPVLLASFRFGPLSGIVVALTKNLIHLLATQTGGVGELANFIVSAALAGVAGLVYRRWKTKRGALVGLICGGLSMTFAGVLANYYITIPFFESLMPLQAIIAACGELIPAVKTKWDVVLFSITPFNLFKASLLSLLTFLLYKHVGRLMRRQ